MNGVNELPGGRSQDNTASVYLQCIYNMQTLSNKYTHILKKTPKTTLLFSLKQNCVTQMKMADTPC